jgi:hypothetical protein
MSYLQHNEELEASVPVESKSHLERFQELYDEIGITPEVEVIGFHTVLRIYSDTSKSLTEGYGGSHTELEFDEEGFFTKQGIWE